MGRSKALYGKTNYYSRARIAKEFKRFRNVISNYLNAPEDYGTEKSEERKRLLVKDASSVGTQGICCPKSNFLFVKKTAILSKMCFFCPTSINTPYIIMFSQKFYYYYYYYCIIL